MPKDALDGLAGRGERRAGGDENVVEEVPPLLRSALHEHQIVGGEHRHPEGLQEILGAPDALAVAEDLVSAGRGDLDLHKRAPAGLFDLDPDDRPATAGPDQRLARAPAERAERRGVADRLEQARLARSVLAGDDRERPGRWVELGVGEVPEVANLQVDDVGQETLTGMSR